MVDIKFIIIIITLCCCLPFAACTSVPKPEQKAPVPVEERSVPVEEKHKVETTTTPPPSPATEPTPVVEVTEPITESELEVKQTSGPAVVALLDDVDQYEKAGKSDQAAATLERALRIEPRNPKLWQRLSYIRLQQGQWQQAIAMAQKSNALAAGDKQLQLTNEKIILQARKMLNR